MRGTLLRCTSVVFVKNKVKVCALARSLWLLVVSIGKYVVQEREEEKEEEEDDDDDDDEEKERSYALKNVMNQIVQ